MPSYALISSLPPPLPCQLTISLYSQSLPVKLLGLSLSLFSLESLSFSSSSRRKSRLRSSSPVLCPVCLWAQHGWNCHKGVHYLEQNHQSTFYRVLTYSLGLGTPNPHCKYLYLSLVWEGRSLLEYCLERADRSPSPFPLPPRAGSNVGRAAVVIFRRSPSLGSLAKSRNKVSASLYSGL